LIEKKEDIEAIVKMGNEPNIEREITEKNPVLFRRTGLPQTCKRSGGRETITGKIKKKEKRNGDIQYQRRIQKIGERQGQTREAKCLASTCQRISRKSPNGGDTQIKRVFEKKDGFGWLKRPGGGEQW